MFFDLLASPAPPKIHNHHVPQACLLTPQTIHPSPDHFLLSIGPAKVPSLGFTQEVMKMLHNSNQKKGQQLPLPLGRASSSLFCEEDTVEEGAMRTSHDGTFSVLQAWF